MGESNGYITRDEILGPCKRRFADVAVPGWGKFRIRSLTELERSRFEATCLDKSGQLSANKLQDVKCRLIVLAVVDQNGDQLLTNSDIENLRQQDSRNTNVLVDEIRRHCSMNEVDFEELTKN